MNMNIIILGPVGSGKSTQAKFLADLFSIPVLSGGDVAYYASQGIGGEEIRDIMAKGELLPDELMLRLMNDHLKGEEHSEGTIIDGFPRTLIEARMFTWPVDRVIYINISDDEAIKRLLNRGRMDDKLEIIKNRLEIYHKETEPVLDYYKEKGLLLEVDGGKNPEEVSMQIEGKLFHAN